MVNLKMIFRKLSQRCAILFVVFATSIAWMSAGRLGQAAQPANEGNEIVYSSFGAIERLDPAIDKLIPAGAKIEKLAAGFDWSEGPVWVRIPLPGAEVVNPKHPDPRQGYLLFSDIPPNRIMKWAPTLKSAVIFMEPAGYSGTTERGGEPGTNGLTIDRESHLVMCDHGDRQIARLEKDGKKRSLVKEYQGKRLNSPNDLCYHSNGDLYFTDPPYGLVKGWDDPARELDFCGVYRLSPTGEVTLLTKELARPNGICLSPDETSLYVAQSDPAKAVLMAYQLQKDGKLGEGKVLFDATPLVKAGKKGLPDGLKVDKDGNIFLTGPGGVLILDPAGKHLGTIATGEATANVAWGDDGSTLYITADMYLARVKTSTRGAGW
ncbi:MAG: SMP-30/gluconolactonase/LRE family protein [Planctomycetota bacterium]|nr:SMP-30/gluconolactonase/LRE family protein [Planctomycetota bacterium]